MNELLAERCRSCLVSGPHPGDDPAGAANPQTPPAPPMISLRANAAAWNHSLAHPTVENHGDDVISYQECFDMCTGLDASQSTCDSESATTNSTTPPFVAPASICAPCLHELRISYTFRQRCWQSDRYLREQWHLAATAKVVNATQSDEAEIGNAEHNNHIVMPAEAGEDDEIDDGGADDSTMWLVETMEEDDEATDIVTDNLIEYDDNETVEQQLIDELDESTTFLDDDVADDGDSKITFFMTSRNETDVESVHRNVEIGTSMLPIDAGQIGAGQFECDYCGKMWHTKPGLLRHMRLDHVQRSDAIE